MKRMIASVVVASLLLLSLQVFAIDWKKYDLDQISKADDGPKTILTLRDKQERVFKAVFQDEAMLEKLVTKIIKYKNEFYSWKKIQFKEMIFMVVDNFLEVIIIPQELTHNQVNLAPAIPAGITMMGDPEKDLMRYDFRIMKDNLFVRINGEYLGEEELTTKLFYAYDYPLVYLQRNDPNALPNSGNGNIGIDEKTRQALIYLLNEDWNGRHKAIPAETIKKVVELKQKNPWMTKNQLWKMLKKEKVRLSKREFELILIVYFNEFELS